MKWTDMDNLVYKNDHGNTCIYKSALLQIAGKVEDENDHEIVIDEMCRYLNMLKKGIRLEN